MSILDSIKMRNGIPVGKNITQQETEGYSPQQRLNFVTLGNAVELGTEIIHSLMKGNAGMSDRQGDHRLLKRDIADLIGARLTAKIQESASTENGGQA